MISDEFSGGDPSSLILPFWNLLWQLPRVRSYFWQKSGVNQGISPADIGLAARALSMQCDFGDPVVGNSIRNCARSLGFLLPIVREGTWSLNLTMIQHRVKGNRSRADRFSANPDCEPPLTAVSQVIRKKHQNRTMWF
jgi:hypothetical protein